MSDPWRETPEETVDLYPGLTVWESRVSGSITAGRSRLPLWAFVPWGEGELYEAPKYGWTDASTANFLGCLLEMRGEFARLLLVLADAERCERAQGQLRPWWTTKRHRKRVSDQLARCLARLQPTSETP